MATRDIAVRVHHDHPTATVRKGDLEDIQATRVGCLVKGTQSPATAQGLLHPEVQVQDLHTLQQKVPALLTVRRKDLDHPIVQKAPDPVTVRKDTDPVTVQKEAPGPPTRRVMVPHGPEVLVDLPLEAPDQQVLPMDLPQTDRRIAPPLPTLLTQKG